MPAEPSLPGKGSRGKWGGTYGEATRDRQKDACTLGPAHTQQPRQAAFRVTTRLADSADADGMPNSCQLPFQGAEDRAVKTTQFLLCGTLSINRH